MFTGFASENTPAIQVHDFFRTFASSAAVRSVSLADDCAPIQVFRTGAATTPIRVYLPTAPIEGKQITIVNQRYAVNAQAIEIYSSDRSLENENPVFTMGAGDSIVLAYSKQNITYGSLFGVAQTGWFSLNRSSTSAGSAYSAVVGGNINAATGQYAFVGGGVNNIASNTYSTVVGGANNLSSGIGSGVIGASDAITSGQNSCAAGGSFNSTNGQNSIALGGQRGITRFITNFAVQGNNSIANLHGTCQAGSLVLGRQTTDANPAVLRSDSFAAGSGNQINLPNNSAYTFQGTVIANVTGGGTTSGWKFEGVVKRGANAASTALVAAVTPIVIAQDAGAATWVVAVTADTTNGGISVTVTGAAATTIRWACKIETTEVQF